MNELLELFSIVFFLISLLLDPSLFSHIIFLLLFLSNDLSSFIVLSKFLYSSLVLSSFSFAFLFLSWFYINLVFESSYFPLLISKLSFVFSAWRFLNSTTMCGPIKIILIFPSTGGGRWLSPWGEGSLLLIF